MNIISSTLDIKKCIDRFYSFYDSVIKKIVIIDAGSKGKIVQLNILARDVESDKGVNDGWVQVVFNFEDVFEFCFKELRKNSLQVISDGIHLDKIENNICMEFGGDSGSPKTLSDYQNSNVYIIGKRLSFDVLPYKDNFVPAM